MKKILLILFHYHYITFKKIQDEISNIVDLKIYSSKLLKEGKQSIDELNKDIEDRDLLILNRVSEDGIWGEIDITLNNCNNERIYVGEEMTSYIDNKEQLEKSIICNNYLTCNGRWNLINMIKYILNSCFHEDIKYDEPKAIPWNAIFHPDYDGYFDNLEDYFKWRKPKGNGVIGLVTTRSYWINEDIALEKEFIKTIEENDYDVIPIYTHYNKDKDNGGIGHSEAIKKYFFNEKNEGVVDAVIKCVSFGLIESNNNYITEDSILDKLNCPIFKPIISSNMSINEWEKDECGATKDIRWSVAMPEIEGNIEPIFVGATETVGNEDIRLPIKERCNKVVARVINYIKLRKLKNKDKRIVFILNNSPCASIEANVGSASNLDTMQSIVNILNEMKKAGYLVENIPKNGEALAKEILDKKAISEFRWTTVNEIVNKGGALELLENKEYLKWFNRLSKGVRDKVIEEWGNPPGEYKDNVPPSMVYNGKIIISGLRFGNVIVCVQPKRGCAGSRCDGKVCKILHNPSVSPTHQYIATYRYFEEKFKANLIIHMGTHGNLEFLPGKSVGLSEDCYSDICIGNVPYINVYNADNPPEGTIAKRRAYATLVDHMQTVISTGGAYDSLANLENLINQYEELRFKDNGQRHILEHLIGEEIKNAKLDNKINIDNIHENIEDVLRACRRILAMITSTNIADGQHILGEIPKGDRLLDFLNSIVRFEGTEQKSLRSIVAKLLGFNFNFLLQNPDSYNAEYKKANSAILVDLDKFSKKIISLLLENMNLRNFKDLYNDYNIVNFECFEEIEKVFKERLRDINKRINESNEIKALLNAMNGSFVKAGPAGVLSRGRDDILPTGRNFYTLDPIKLPTRAANEIGKRLADKVIEKHLNEEGKYPENFAMYWMANDFMWSDGEGMAQLMNFIGVTPIWDNSGRVKEFKVIPLSDLKRPRIDITVKISGILRDAFLSRVELLDEAVKAVAELDEPLDMNYVRKHTLKNIKDNGEGKNKSTNRIFGSKAGTYFSAVTGLIYSSSWKEKDDIADIFMYYNGYAYGKNKYGEKSYKELKNSLSTVDITYNKATSDEHDLLGCCTYFSTHGGMTSAARKVSNKSVKAYYGDTREVTNVEIRDLSEELDRVAKGKLLNPKWIEGQKRHGYVGASQISKLVGRVYGWDATTDEVDDKLFDDIAETFVLNDENRKFFKENNPYALEEIGRRLIEAYKRNLWNVDDELIDQLQNYYIEMEGWIEEGLADMSGDFQGGSVDIVDLNEVEYMKKNLDLIKRELQ